MRPSIFNIIAQALGNGQGTGAGKFGPSGAAPAPTPIPMLGIPGMGGGGGRGGFLSRGAGGQGGMSPITQTVLGKEAEKRRQQAMKLQEKARMMEQEANELEMPKQTRAINDTEAGIGSLLMLLAGALGGGEGAADFAGGFMRSREQGAARTDEENMRRYQQQQRSMQIGAGNEMERAKMELGEADRIEGRVDAENQRNLKLQDDEAKRKSTALSSVIGRLSSDLDKAPYERIPTIISQMNEAYKALGYPEMVIPQGDIDSMVSQAKANAEAALKTKAQDARTRLFRAIVPYATNEAERNKLAKWVNGMTEADLDVSLGKSEAELYQEAKRQTENEMRPGKVEGQDLKNQLKEFEVKYADQYYKNRNKKQVVDIAHVEEKTKLLPESIRLSAGRLRIAEMLAENSLGNTAFDNELAAWKARTQPEVQGHIARVKKIEERMAEIRQEIEDTSDEGKAEELTVELTSLSRDRANVVARLDALTEKVPVPQAKVDGKAVGSGATQPGGTYGKDTGWHKGVAEWVKKQGFEPSAGFNPGRHNKGSQHDYGDALDVRIGGKTPAQIEAFMKEALRMGWSVRDERVKPSKNEQEKWGGPHIHLSRPKDGVPKMTRTTGGGRATTPKSETKPAAKGGTQTVNVSGTPVKVKTR